MTPDKIDPPPLLQIGLLVIKPWNPGRARVSDRAANRNSQRNQLVPTRAPLSCLLKLEQIGLIHPNGHSRSDGA